MRVRHIAAVVVLVGGSLASTFIFLRASADSAPKISNVTVADVEATSTTITWNTDVKTDSFLSVSEDTNYCGIRNTGDLGTSHSVAIPDLIPGTTYFVRIRSTDVGGNQSYSGDYTFTTSSTLNLANIPNVTQRNLTSQAAASIQNITNLQALAALAQVVNSQATANGGVPKILGNPHLDVGAQQVTVTWSTDVNSDGSVYVASDAEYVANPGNYSQKDDDTNTNSQTHTVTVSGLTPSTLYHYKVSSRGPVGDPGESADLTFTTKSLLPDILSPRLTKVEEHGATITWATPFPTAGTVEYTNLSNRKTLSVGDPTLLVTHSIQLTSLIFQTRYSAVIKATNQAGDTVTSEPLYFVTTKNLVPPIISQVNNDSTLYPGQDTTVQTVISWVTDEPAQCNLSYVSGGGARTSPDVVSSTPEAAPLQKHVDVVTNFQPATVYKYWVTCTDVDGNATSSEDFVLLTPEQQKSIIDLILDNFKGTFGWLNGIGGAKK